MFGTFTAFVAPGLKSPGEKGDTCSQEEETVEVPRLSWSSSESSLQR